MADLEPIVRELRLERVPRLDPGRRADVSDASRHPWGHANAWPLPVDPAEVRAAARPPCATARAREVFDELRRRASPRRLRPPDQPPALRATGYFDQLGFDPATRRRRPTPGYDAALRRARGLERPQRRRAAERPRATCFALLRTGHPVTPTADTDTHGIVGQEAGYPRTYVRVADDGPLDAWDAARTRRPGARREDAARRRADERADAPGDGERRAHRRHRAAGMSCR